MRIGIDARMIDWAGVGRYTRNLLDNLAKIDSRNEYILFCYQQSKGLIPVADNFIFRPVTQPVFSMSSQLSWARDVSRAELSIFHSPSYVVPLLFSQNSVVTMHDLIPLLFPDNLQTKAAQISYISMIRLAVKRSSRIIAVSEHTKSDLVQHLGVPEEKLTTIYEAAEGNYRVINDTEKIEQALRHYGVKKPYFLWVGNYKPHKNVVRLIEAFSKLQKKEKLDDLSLVLVGPRDKRFPEAPKLISKLGMEDRIRQTGFVLEEDLVCLYSAATAFVLPSLYEGFGLTVLEAMACGTPVICSNSSSLPEVAGEAACFIDPNDSESITIAMKRILDDSMLSEALSKKGLKQAGKFSWMKTAQQTLAVYERVAEMGD